MNPVNGTVLANVMSNATRLSVGQSHQLANGVCTKLIYTVFSTEPFAAFKLYPDGPCDSQGISSKPLHITFLPCDCPKGLQPASLDNECRCECDPALHSYISNCQLYRNGITVSRVTNQFWLKYVHFGSKNTSGFLLHKCPYDYCLDKPVNLSINFPVNTDNQCAFNRSGVMCGECQEGLSLVFGSSRCVQCSNYYLALLIPFALAGIVLVAFILIPNITVAIGTIHGATLYANIVGANNSVFLASKTALSIFVSWLNLDLGIETCFYENMDSYAKVLLQLVFPTYIFLLAAFIIFVSNYWGRFAGLIGRKNPVATLCTLFLLSYSKLLRAIIFSLHFSQLSYPDGAQKVVWTYDSNILYLTPNRTPFFSHFYHHSDYWNHIHNTTLFWSVA